RGRWHSTRPGRRDRRRLRRPTPKTARSLILSKGVPMSRTLAAVVAVLGVLAAARPAPAQDVDPAAYINGLYQGYLGVDAPAHEMALWLEQLRQGASAFDVHAAILGGEGFFNRVGRDPEAFTRAAYRVLGRDPEPNEVRYWVRGLRRYEGDRVRW